MSLNRVIIPLLLIVSACAPAAPQAQPPSAPPQAVQATRAPAPAIVTAAAPAVRATVPASQVEDARDVPNSVAVAVAVAKLPDANIGPTVVTFVDALHGWVGYGTSVFATDDAGEHWVKRYQAQDTVQDLDFISATRGWAVFGTQAFVTQDGGATWQMSSAARTDGVYRLDFLDATHGWMLRGFGRVALFQTDDGGASWQVLKSPCVDEDDERLGFLQRAAPNSIWALCLGGNSSPFQRKTVLKTVDNGEHWTTSAKTEFNKANASGGIESGFVTSFFALDPTHAWVSTSSSASGSNELYVTQDGGHSWHTVGNLFDYTKLTNLRFISRTHGFAVLEARGTPQATVATRDGGTTWTYLYPPIQPAEMPLMLDALHGFAIGTLLDSGAVLATADGGQTWQPLATLAGVTREFDQPPPLAFADLQHGCLRYRQQVAEGFTELQQRTADGGRTWTTEPADARCAPSQAAQVAHWRVYNERLFFSADGLTDWIAHDLGGVRVNGVLFVDDTHGWVRAVGNHLYRTSDGGRSWQQLY